MNTEELRKNVGSQVRLRPIAESVDSRVDDLWTIRRVDHASVELQNQRTGHIATLGNDNIAEFRSPGFLALRCQLTLTANEVLLEPLFPPLGTRGGPAAEAPPLTQEEHDLLIRSRERGELHVLSGAQGGKLVRVGHVSYFDADDPAVAVRYRDALDSLCRRGLARHEADVLYRLTTEGFKASRGIQPRLKIELPQPVNPPGHRGPPYTPAWNVSVRLIATQLPLSVVSIRLEEERVGGWPLEELSQGGVAVPFPLHVPDAVQFWMRAHSPRTFEGGPVRLGTLTLRVRDHLQPACDAHDFAYGPVTIP
jgi:hypothetical protein